MSEEGSAPEVEPSGIAGLLDTGAAAPVDAADAPVAPAGDPGDSWYGVLSDEAPGEGQLSDRAWLENKKYADLGALVKSARALEGRFLSGDKLVLPREGDPPEVFDAWAKAIGRPDSAEEYDLAAPEGQELDPDLAGRIRDVAFQSGVPAGMLKPLAEAFNGYVLEQMQNAEAQAAEAKRAGVAEIRSEWGDRFNANVAHANKAMRMLGLDAERIGKIEDGLGTADTLRLLSRLGAGMGEDVLIGGGEPQSFSISPAEAREELRAMREDAAKREKLLAKDPALSARRDMLIQVVARDEERHNTL